MYIVTVTKPLLWNILCKCCIAFQIERKHIWEISLNSFRWKKNCQEGSVNRWNVRENFLCNWNKQIIIIMGLVLSGKFLVLQWHYSKLLQDCYEASFLFLVLLSCLNQFCFFCCCCFSRIFVFFLLYFLSFLNILSCLPFPSILYLSISNQFFLFL